MRRLSLVLGAVVVASIATSCGLGDDLCQQAADHTARCTGMDVWVERCDVEDAEARLAMSCEEMEDLGKADSTHLCTGSFGCKDGKLAMKLANNRVSRFDTGPKVAVYRNDRKIVVLKDGDWLKDVKEIKLDELKEKIDKSDDKAKNVLTWAELSGEARLAVTDGDDVWNLFPYEGKVDSDTVGWMINQDAKMSESSEGFVAFAETTDLGKAELVYRYDDKFYLLSAKLDGEEIKAKVSACETHCLDDKIAKDGEKEDTVEITAKLGAAATNDGRKDLAFYFDKTYKAKSSGSTTESGATKSDETKTSGDASQAFAIYVAKKDSAAAKAVEARIKANTETETKKEGGGTSGDADLSIEDFVQDKEDPLKFKVKVCNTGSEKLTDVNLRFWFDLDSEPTAETDDPTQKEKIGSLEAKGDEDDDDCETKTVSIKKQKGLKLDTAYTAWALVLLDDKAQVTASKDYELKEKDFPRKLTVEKLAVNKENDDDGKRKEFHGEALFEFKVCYEGAPGSDSGKFKAALYFDEEPKCGAEPSEEEGVLVDIESLASGKCSKVWQDRFPRPAGEFKVYVLADADCKVVEKPDLASASYEVLATDDGCRIGGRAPLGSGLWLLTLVGLLWADRRRQRR